MATGKGNGSSGLDLWVELQASITALRKEVVAIKEGSGRMEEQLTTAIGLIGRLADEAMAVQAELRDHRERLTALERKVG